MWAVEGKASVENDEAGGGEGSSSPAASESASPPASPTSASASASASTRKVPAAGSRGLLYVYGGEVYPGETRLDFGERAKSGMLWSDTNGYGVMTTDDFFVLDIARKKWTRLDVLGDSPGLLQVQL